MVRSQFERTSIRQLDSSKPELSWLCAGTWSRNVEAQINPMRPIPSQICQDVWTRSGAQRKATPDIASAIIKGATMIEIELE